MRPVHVVAVVALLLSALIVVYGQLPKSGSQDAKTSTQDQRGKAKKILVKELPNTLRGITLDKGVFKLKPGYKFVPQPNGAVAVAVQGAGGGVSGSFDCFCDTEGGGSCSVTTVGSTISCGKSKTTPCSGGCILRTTIGGNRTRLAIY